MERGKRGGGGGGNERTVGLRFVSQMTISSYRGIKNKDPVPLSKHQGKSSQTFRKLRSDFLCFTQLLP